MFAESVDQPKSKAGNEMSYENWDEKRKFKRFDSDLAVRFRPAGDATADFVEGRIRNISLGGVFIHTPVMHPVGTDMHIVVRVMTPFGEERDVEAEGKVCWHGRKGEEEGLGLQFTKVERHAQYAILACAYRGDV